MACSACFLYTTQAHLSRGSDPLTSIINQENALQTLSSGQFDGDIASAEVPTFQVTQLTMHYIYVYMYIIYYTYACMKMEARLCEKNGFKERGQSLPCPQGRIKVMAKRCSEDSLLRAKGSLTL